MVIAVTFTNQVWCLMHMVLALGRLMQEDHSEFEASLDSALKNKARRNRKKNRRKRKKM